VVSHLDSALESDIPACAALKAPQSLAPSPHMAISQSINNFHIITLFMLIAFATRYYKYGFYPFETRTYVITESHQLHDQLLLLIAAHSGKYCTAYANAIHEIGIIFSHYNCYWLYRILYPWSSITPSDLDLVSSARRNWKNSLIEIRLDGCLFLNSY